MIPPKQVDGGCKMLQCGGIFRLHPLRSHGDGFAMILALFVYEDYL